MNTVAYPQSSNYLRLGAAGAIGAVSMLWSGSMSNSFFQAGSVLLVISLIALARGFGARGGAIFGLLIGMVWVAARLGFARSLELHVLLAEMNIIAVLAMMTIGGLAGALLGPAEKEAFAGATPQAGSTASAPPPATEHAGRVESTLAFNTQELLFSRALGRHREWVANCPQDGPPWASFDNHVRDIVRLLSGMRRLRCYRVGPEGQLLPMATDHHPEGIESPSKALLTHVVTTGRRFLANTSSTGPLVQVLADSGDISLVWAVPIRDNNTTIGLITAEGAPDPVPAEALLDAVGDLAEQLWLHVHHLEALRLALQTDRGSGLINRTDFMPALRATLNQCYNLHEPVVVMVVCLEGLRKLDDASHWSQRDALVERVGQTIAAGIRKDDIVGRFSDAQFVALLRRLDTPLAELICRKLLSNIARVICEFELTDWITPRAGLSGSGFTKVPVEHLLQHAIAALGTARSHDLLLVSERPDKPAEEGAS